MLPVLQGLRSKTKLKAKGDESYRKFELEITKMCDELGKFVDDKCGDTLAEAESYSISSPVADILRLGQLVEATTRCAEHHLAGAKLAKSRFTGLLA